MPVQRRARTGGRKLYTANDVINARRMMQIVALSAVASLQLQWTRSLLWADSTSAFDDEINLGLFWQSHCQMMSQVALVLYSAQPFFRPGVTYMVGPEHYSFERLERQFGQTTTCKATFRFEAAHLRRLCRALRFPDVMSDHNFSATGEEVFLYMIKRLSYPATLSTLAWDSGRNISAQSEMFKQGIEHVYHNFAHLRDNRSLECWAHHFPMFAAHVQRGGRKGRAPLNNCIGWVDGSNQFVSKPHLNQGIMFNGHKRKHCVKWQGVMLPNGIMPMPFGPINGSNTDAFMLERSGLVRAMRRACKKVGAIYQLYGDPAYPQSHWIGGPFRHSPLNYDEADFNSRMSSVRIVNEWGFGRIKINWAFLDFENSHKVYLNDVQKYWPVAQILQNCHVCFYGNQVSEYFDCKAPEVEVYLSNNM